MPNTQTQTLTAKWKGAALTPTKETINTYGLINPDGTRLGTLDIRIVNAATNSVTGLAVSDGTLIASASQDAPANKLVYAQFDFSNGLLNGAMSADSNSLVENDNAWATISLAGMAKGFAKNSSNKLNVDFSECQPGYYAVLPTAILRGFGRDGTINLYQYC